jgi:CubicO group peptidase (beta-lactamase class C family)
MIRTALAATAMLLAAAAPASAQSQQEQLDTRYNRALAAGYRALMLCGAIGNQPDGLAMRDQRSVEELELTGIQPELAALMDAVVGDPVGDVRGRLSYVWARHGEDGPLRLAAFRAGKGCALAPMGTVEDDLKRLFPEMLPPGISPPMPRPRQHRAIAPERLTPLRAALNGSYGQGTRTTAVLVSLHGDTVDEGYRADFGTDTPQRTWSVAKSIAATLVGAAAYRGEADVKASAGLGVSDADPRRAISIDHLLRMASGRYSDTPGNRTDPLYWGGATVEEVALDWPLIAPPSSTFRYANNDTIAAVAAIKPTFAEHSPAEFFAKLGMNATVAETDWQGNYILSSQVWTTANDLAKFGQLYLNDGKLTSGERILPEGWVKYVTTPSGPQPPTGTFGYGAGFWLLNREEGVPPDTFAAIGNRGQYVVIVPSRQMVIVRRGEDPAGTGFDIAAFTRDVLAALEAE